ncbi:MAG: hypothetical protein JHC88_00935 [Niveispirillum sp.]|nr:hypothetical protein [Niveispirillum sp.]
MDGKPAIEIDDTDLGPFADADPAWLRAQVLPALEEYDRDPSTGVELSEAFRRVRAMLRDRVL